MSDAFVSLERFIRQDMRMSHIYQPVMLLELLGSGGTASIRQIAKALLAEDASQIEYYEQIVKNMFPQEPRAHFTGNGMRRDTAASPTYDTPPGHVRIPSARVRGFQSPP